MAVFAIIGPDISNSKCLDLYSGSGNLGIEALSRGASHCDLVDEDYESIGAINSNLASCGLASKAMVHKKDSVKFVSTVSQEVPTPKYNYIFADPFYDQSLSSFLLENIGKILDTGGKAFIFQARDKVLLKEGEVVSGLKVESIRFYGKSALIVLIKNS